MLPNMKFYVVSIVAIFTALGIGIFIGFSMDTKGFILDQQEGLVDLLEGQFEKISRENQILESRNEELLQGYKNKNIFINKTYDYMIPEQLDGLKVAIIESNQNYTSSGIGKDLEDAGAFVGNVLTINNKFFELKDIRAEIENIVDSLLTDGDGLKKLEKNGYIELMGNYYGQYDKVIICGGAAREDDTNVAILDRYIIEELKNRELGVLGVEKSRANISYMGKYKEYRIPTVDNVDTVMGKIAMVLALKGNSGNYGIKGTAETIIPSAK